MNFQIFVIDLLALLHTAFSVNLKNNECSKIYEYHVAAFSPHCRYNPDVLSDVPRLIENNGYLVDKHTVTSSSGYILNLYRVRSKEKSATGYPIIVIHGIAVETGTWANIGNRSLAFNLVEAGYDVWLASLRGTADSKKHTTWNINNPAYWNFSLDEPAKEDVGAQVTYIFENTNQKVLIIGHSMGTTLSLIYVSEYAEEANRVLKGIVALAPVIYLTDLPVFKYVQTPVYILLSILDVLHIRGLLYEDKLVHHLIVALCKILPEICYEFITRAAGKTEQFLPDDLLSFWSYWPSGTSVRQLKHFLQISHYKSFQKYDFGTANENKKHYNTSKPPLYNLGNVQVPVCVYYGQNDIFYLQKNIDRLYNELGTSRKFFTSTPTTNVSENLQFAHIDFVNSKNIIEYLYVPVLEKLETFFN